MGNLRYFEKTHLLRCKGRVGEGKSHDLISDSFCEGKVVSNKVRKSATPKWDNKRGNIVCSLLAGYNKLESTHKNCQGTPKTQNTFVSKRRQSLYAANVCFECTEHYEDITRHFSQEHPDLSEPFYCLACQSFFSSHKMLFDHMDIDHNFKQSYLCDHCSSNFETQSKLNRHISELHPEKELLYSCHMCTKTLTSFPALKQHQKTHTNTHSLPLLSIVEAFTCRFCNIEIMYGPHLEKHIRTEHIAQLSVGEKLFYCHICNQEERQSFDEFYHLEHHLMKSHSVSIENICRFCRKAFNNRNKFVSHFKEVHPGENPFECPRLGCGKTLAKKLKMKDHLIMHRLKEGDISEDMKILCNECGKVFYIKKKLDEHIRLVHKKRADAKEKKYQCHHCIKAFFSNSQLQEHIRKHEGNPGYMCDHCGKGFYRKDRLAIHSKTVHFGVKNFVCTMCEKKFVDNYKLKRHLKTHETVKPCFIKTDPEQQQPSLLRQKLNPKKLIDIEHHSNSPINYSIDESSCLSGLTVTQYLSRDTLDNQFLQPSNQDSDSQAAPGQKKVNPDKVGDQQFLINNQLFH